MVVVPPSVSKMVVALAVLAPTPLTVIPVAPAYSVGVMLMLLTELA
jgi:hypothetical protein